VRHQLPLRYLDVVARNGSIRKAAEQLAITSSALNRRILAMEDDLGVPIFDRVATGVRLNAAGEILIHHFRSQLAEMERVKSQIHDLQGERRGHIGIACSQALMVSILPDEIFSYRAQHPAVSFSLRVCTRHSAVTELKSFNSELALVFEPELSVEFESVASIPQQLHAQMPATHPLSGEGTIRLRDCLEYPLALPTTNNGVRYLLDQSAARLSISLNVAIESDNSYLLRRVVEDAGLISFVASAGILETDKDNALVHRPISEKDVPPSALHIGKLKGRHLSVAASKFLQQLTQRFE